MHIHTFFYQLAAAAGGSPPSDAALLIASFVSQLKINGVVAFVIQQLKVSKAPALAWINENTPWVCRGIAAIAAAFTSLGLKWTYNSAVAGGTFIVTGLSLTVIVTALWHIAQNYLFQHAWYKVVFNKPAAPNIPNPAMMMGTGKGDASASNTKA